MSAANSLSAIQEVGSGGDFMSHESTLDHCRSIWMPSLSVWSSYLQWAKQPEQDLLKKARARLSSILETQQTPCLDAAVDTAIAEYLERGLQ